MEHKIKKEKKSLDIYSETVHDILSDPPNSIFMWGNFIAMSFLILLLSLSWIISYPDTVRSQITITTQIPPEKIIAKSTGKIQKLFAKNNANVNAGDIIAVIDSPSNYKDVLTLKAIIDSIDNNTDDFFFPIERLSHLNLGTIEKTYDRFEKDYNAYRLNKDLQPYKPDIDAKYYENKQLQQRLELLTNQEKILILEQSYKQKELNRYKNLLNKGVISQQEWENKNIEFLEQEKKTSILKSQISQVFSSINDLNKNLKTTNLNQTKDNLNLFRNVNLSFSQLKNAINEWEINYILRASIPGQVTFLKIWTENQIINLGDEGFAIIPKNESNFIGKIKAPISNSGKIKIGQIVNIRLANYPDKEFGIIKGVIQNISMTPDRDDNILIDIKLPYGITTSYKKNITFQQEMHGTADIVTEDLRLIERILYQFIEVFKR